MSSSTTNNISGKDFLLLLFFLLVVNVKRKLFNCYKLKLIFCHEPYDCWVAYVVCALALLR